MTDMASKKGLSIFAAGLAAFAFSSCSHRPIEVKQDLPAPTGEVRTTSGTGSKTSVSRPGSGGQCGEGGKAYNGHDANKGYGGSKSGKGRLPGDYGGQGGEGGKGGTA